MANSSSLSNVVTNLVRAQMGASIPASTLDEELDRRVAELILQEARKKEATFNRTGSYSPQIPGNAVKTNKRFLSSIIKSTDEHNKAILKVQADAAQEVKQQRDLEERRERLKRAEEAVSARLGGSNSPWSGRDDDRGRRRRSVSQERHDRHIGASRPDRKRDRSRHSDVTDDELRKRKRPRHEYDSTEQRDSTERRSYSPSSKHRRESRNYDRGSEAHISHRSRRREGEKDDEGHKQRKRNRSRSRSPRRTDHRRRSRSPKATDSRASDSKSSHKGKRRAEPQRTTVNDQEPKRTLPEVKLKQLRGEDRGSSTPKPPSRMVEETRGDAVSDSGSDIGPYPEDHEKTLREYSSKMDKYFARDYDPRLDVETTAPDSIIPPGAFDNWDWMLQVVRARREEKEEKKRLEKLYKNDPSKKDKTKTTTSMKADVQELMNIQYTKRGGVREWDEGKKDI